MGVRLLADRGVELELLSVDLAFGDADVLDLQLHLARLRGLRLRHVDLFLDRRPLELERLLGVGDLGVDGEALLLLELARALLLQRGVPIGTGGGDPGVLQGLLDLGLAERVQIALVVLDLLEYERLELEAHALEVGVGLLADALLEPLLVAVQLLDGEGADDAAQVTGHGLLDGALDLLRRDAQEALRGTPHVVDVAGDLDLRHGLHVDGDALHRVDVLEVDVEGHHLEGDDLGGLPRRPHEGAAAADDPERLHLALLVADLPAGQLAPAVDDERLVGPRLLVAEADRQVGEEDEDENDGRIACEREQLHDAPPRRLAREYHRPELALRQWRREAARGIMGGAGPYDLVRRR